VEIELQAGKAEWNTENFEPQAFIGTDSKCLNNSLLGKKLFLSFNGNCWIRIRCFNSLYLPFSGD
jgi:hypothetical protein